MRSLSVIIFFMFLSWSSFATDVQAELHLISPPAILKEGDLLEGVLKVWPVEGMAQDEFKKLENMVLANALFVSSIESVDVSPNNSDVLEVKLLFIVKRAKENTISSINYRGQAIPIQFPPLNIEVADKEPKDFYVMDQGFINSNLLKIIIGIFTIALLLLGIWKRKYIKELIRKHRSDPIVIATKKYHEMFLSTATRLDYEKIYALRKDWLALVKVQAPAYGDFFKTMELHQYKKQWSQEELNEVQTSFDVIRGSFK